MRYCKLFCFLIIILASCSKTIDNRGTCSDGIKNQDELGIDCGGPCPGHCENCGDGIKNQGETAVDCGGPCDPCYERLTATVDNISWNATTRNAFLAGPGILRIYGTNVQNNLTLYYSGYFSAGTVPTGNKFSAEFRDENGNIYTSQTGGQISFFTFDTAARTVSGIYNFTAVDTVNGGSKTINNGVFTNIVY
jgi:hypothetical protein